MLRLILLPFKLLWQIFRFLCRAVLTIAVSVLIFILGVYLLNTPSLKDTELTQQVNESIRTFLKTFVEQEATPSEIATDHLTGLASGTRWEKAEATIYIASTDETFRNAYLQAIDSWNASGAFTFKLVEEKAKANIVATDYEDAQTPAAGLAEATANQLTRRFTKVTVKLNRYFLLNPAYGYDAARIQHTAAHELGHAIGLDHEDEVASVMASSGSFHNIQVLDVERVRQLYREN